MNTTARIGDLLEERSTLVSEAREILNTADGRSRDLTAEERQEYDRREARIKEIEGDVRRRQEQQRAENLDLRGAEPDPVSTPEVPAGRDSDEYRDAFNAAMRGQATAEQRSTLNTATDADGGYAVPESWTDLHESLRESGVVRQLATVIQTEMGGPLHVPYVSADATAPVITAEVAAIADDGETFAEKVINAFKFARITKASDELVQDALFDVAGFVGRRLGFDLGRAANGDYVNGDGSGNAEGLFHGATSTDTLASATAITSDEVIDLMFSVTAPYRANGVWIANDSTIGAIRKLKDTTNQYLWQPSYQAGVPDMLLGRPVYADPDVSPLVTAKKVLGFGDVARAYLIRDVGGLEVKYLDQLYAGTGQVGWRGQLRTGGAVVDANAFKVVTTA